MEDFYLKEIQIKNFKNISETYLSFAKKTNCLVGLNGAGKTNLLDAIYYLSFTKSFFNITDNQIIKNNENNFFLKGIYVKKKDIEEISIYYDKNTGKIIKRNGKKYKRFADHIGLLPIVFLIPQDTEIIYEGPQERRKFTDIIISQYNNQYLKFIIAYNKLLAQRNHLLKLLHQKNSSDYRILETYDKKICQYATYIFTERKKFIENFMPIFQQYYNKIAENKEIAKIIYASQLIKTDCQKLLTENRNKDFKMLYTTAGVHRDDFIFLLNEKTLKKFGSSGQQKTFIIALKFAQAHILKKILNIPPILMLDDIFDKLDSKRVNKIIELITDSLFGQTFITHTNIDELKNILNTPIHKIFSVQNGYFKQI